MRVVFMGTPAFAVPSLDALLTSHDVVAVYTRPDRGSGRGKRVTASPVKQRALEAGVTIEQPPTLRAVGVADRLASFSPDVVVVAAYGAILPPDVLAVPRFGCVNVHGSLLPRWRGAAPVQQAILAGDAVTGVSIMLMEEGLDTGPYALQVVVPVDAKTTDGLTADLANAGADSLVATLAAIADGTVEWTPQPADGVTYASKVTAADVALSPEIPVADALRRVRAQSRSAPCRALIVGRRVVVVGASESALELAPGTASCARELVLGFADGSLLVDAVVPEGRSKMAGDAFVRGARLDASCTWGMP
jgi:methionyl-tRNA formyltransferase